eukprot:6190361-Pleurochrysis_carterae.AAC.2
MPTTMHTNRQPRTVHALVLGCNGVHACKSGEVEVCLLRLSMRSAKRFCGKDSNSNPIAWKSALKFRTAHQTFSAKAAVVQMQNTQHAILLQQLGHLEATHVADLVAVQIQLQQS